MNDFIFADKPSLKIGNSARHAAIFYDEAQAQTWHNGGAVTKVYRVTRASFARLEELRYAWEHTYKIVDLGNGIFQVWRAHDGAWWAGRHGFLPAVKFNVKFYSRFQSRGAAQAIVDRLHLEAFPE